MSKVLELVLEAVNEVGEDQGCDALIEATEETQLFGEHLDSMGIVFLITDLEQKISEELDVDLVLADERAMSQNTSPFRNVKTLAKYVTTLIAEQQT